MKAMKTKYIFLATLSAILMSSCDGNDFGDNFVAKSEGIYLDVDDVMTFEVRENLTKSIEVKSVNTDWAISGFENADWLTVSPISGRGQQNVTITVKPNENIGSRSCNLRLTSGDGENAYVKEFKVSQESDANIITITNGTKSTSFIMKRVYKGTFTAGWPASKSSLHEVTLTKSFYICEHETTQLMWEIVMGKESANTKFTSYSGIADNLPAYSISYSDCLEFIKKLNAMTGLTFRLPWAAEWEYAAKGGTKSMGYQYAGSNSLSSVAWYKDNSNSMVHTVKTKSPNEIGLYDMSGNLEEWCADWANYYYTTPETDPTGPSTGTKREIRGGYYGTSILVFLEPGRTSSEEPTETFGNGFRLAM